MFYQGCARNAARTVMLWHFLKNRILYKAVISLHNHHLKKQIGFDVEDLGLIIRFLKMLQLWRYFARGRPRRAGGHGIIL